jgi:hypothetical protein
VESGSLLVEHDFVWQSDRNGVLDATAWLNIIGAWQIYSPGSCSKTPGASLRIGADLSIAQQLSGQQVLTLTSPERTILEKSRTTHCVGTVSAGPVTMNTGDVELNRNSFPLQKGKAVLATITLAVQMSAWAGGESLFDVGSHSAYQYNVPSVWFSVES